MANKKASCQGPEPQYSGGAYIPGKGGGEWERMRRRRRWGGGKAGGRRRESRLPGKWKAGPWQSLVWAEKGPVDLGRIRSQKCRIQTGANQASQVPLRIRWFSQSWRSADFWREGWRHKDTWVNLEKLWKISKVIWKCVMFLTIKIEC